MCLAVNQIKGYTFSDEWLEDFYSFNPDGIGVMWAEDGTISTCKLVPNTVEELKEFYHEYIAGKACSFHYRWRTHGDTDLLNCHPYEVFGDGCDYQIYLMHNGVLETGNKNDITKSDTWHYINDVIRPALQADPTQFMSEWFKLLIENHIGRNNKFIMMDAYGNTVTFNESAGVMFEGNWMSNTYAWSAPRPKPVAYENKYPTLFNENGNGYNHSEVPSFTNYYKKPWGYDDLSDAHALAKVPGQKPKKTKHKKIKSEAQEAWDFALEMQDVFKAQLWNKAASAIALYEIKEHYLNVGSSTAMTLIFDIEDGNYSEEDVIDMMTTSHNVDTSARLAVGML